jgi:hypothetical protein
MNISEIKCIVLGDVFAFSFYAMAVDSSASSFI